MNMNTNIVPGATVRGPFTVYNNQKEAYEVLIDKHLIVLAVSQGKAMCMYTGTFDSSNLHHRLPGYVEITQPQNVAAGWKMGKKFYADACQLCVVPVELLQRNGAVSDAFLKTLLNRVLALKGRVVTTAYSATAEQRVTGARRQMKSGVTA